MPSSGIPMTFCADDTAQNAMAAADNKILFIGLKFYRYIYDRKSFKGNVMYEFIGVGAVEAFHPAASDTDIVEDDIIDRTVGIVAFQ